MKILRWGAALALLWGAVAACGLDKTVNQISARRLVVATLLSTPEIRVPLEALAGLDAGALPSFDAGLPPDAGFAFDAGFTFDAGLSFDGGLVIPPQTVAFAFFGERQGDGFQLAPVPLANTTLQFEPEGGPAYELTPGAQGTYARSSFDDPSFQYVAGRRWTVRATSGDVYLAEVDAVPGNEHIRQLHPDAGFITLPAGTGLLLTRPDPPGTLDRNLGFVTVVPVSVRGEQGAPTWTNVPSDAFGFIKLVAAPREWKKTEVEIPGAAFPDADRNYLVILQSAKLGGPVSENLWIGSAILAGTADVGVVRTTAP